LKNARRPEVLVKEIKVRCKSIRDLSIAIKKYKTSDKKAVCLNSCDLIGPDQALNYNDRV
jgi:hypothetical protein